MLKVEFIPLNKGNRILLDDDDDTSIIIGRTPSTGCVDNKVSRNHTELFVKSDSTLWIKPIHQNPTFYKTKTDEIVTLTKDKEYQLFDNDQFGLLPDEYFYRVSIIHPTTSTTIPKRQQCTYGEYCYRKNATHRQQLCHPGDSDWEDDENETSTIPSRKKVVNRLKRKTSEIDDDDDGSPNEYNYNDSFIDDNSSASDNEDNSGSNYSPDESSDESDFDLTKDEAAEFVKSSSSRKDHGHVNKRFRLEDDD